MARSIALRENGTPQPFQITMKRFGRKLDVDGMQAELPLTPFFFDALYFDGTRWSTSRCRGACKCLTISRRAATWSRGL